MTAADDTCLPLSNNLYPPADNAIRKQNRKDPDELTFELDGGGRCAQGVPRAASSEETVGTAKRV